MFSLLILVQSEGSAVTVSSESSKLIRNFPEGVPAAFVEDGKKVIERRFP